MTKNSYDYIIMTIIDYYIVVMSKNQISQQNISGRKVAIIHSIYRPETRGGAEVVVESIVNGLAQQGEDVLVISVGRKTTVETGRASSLRVYRIKPFNVFNFLDINKKPWWLRLPWHILDMFNDVQTWRIYKVLNKEKPDMVLTHNLKGLGYYIPWLLRIMKIRQIHTVHDMQLLHPSSLLKKKPLIFYGWFCKKLFGSPEVVIFPSQYIKSVYEKYGFFKKSKKIVLYNPIQIPGSKFQVQNSKFNILFLGQVEEYKGIFNLIKTVESIKNDFTLHVVGDGKALDKAKKLSDNNKQIKFYGRLSQNELKKIWSQIDLLINPSQTPESFGMVVIEAYAHGVPVLVSDIGALPELVIEGKTGFVSNNLEEKLKWCIDNRDQLKNMRQNCSKEAKKYDTSHYLNKLMEFVKIN